MLVELVDLRSETPWNTHEAFWNALKPLGILLKRHPSGSLNYCATLMFIIGLPANLIS